MLELIRKILALFQKKSKINLADYPIKTDYGTLNSEQINAMDNILAACKAGEETAEIGKLTQKEFDVVVTHIGMHFGNTYLFRNIALMRRNVASINLDIYSQAREYKKELDIRVDDVLSTLYEGTIEYKLKQVCQWIAANCKYKHGNNDVLKMLDDKGACGAFSMLFYKMATRLGVETHICGGDYTDSFGRTMGHAWNMVKIDGKIYYYDATHYDNTYMTKYIHSETPWGREYELDPFTVSYNYNK